MTNRVFLTFIVEPEDEGATLSGLLRSRFGLSRGMIRRLKKCDAAQIDGETALMRRKLRAGERVTVYMPHSFKEPVEPEPLPLDIRYEDTHLLVVEKPAGMLVHPAGYEQSGTLANGVVYHLQAKGETAGAGAVTRLDRGTSGLVLFAKHPHAHHLLTQALRRGEVKREYAALVHGRPVDDGGVVDAPIRRISFETSQRIVAPDGQPALTRYQVVARYPPAPDWPSGAALVHLDLGTGRTHQIRVHMSHLGHPLIGDRLYGRPQEHLIGRPALHARRLGLLHPLKGYRLELTSEPPADFQRLVQRIEAV